MAICVLVMTRRVIYTVGRLNICVGFNRNVGVGDGYIFKSRLGIAMFHLVKMALSCYSRWSVEPMSVRA